MGDGKFFEKRSTSTGANFFRDLPGRSSGSFYKEGMIPAAPPNVGPAGPMPGAAMPGSPAPGASFGTGKGKEEKHEAPTSGSKDKDQEEKGEPNLAALAGLISNAEKTAETSDQITGIDLEDTGVGPLPSGFHRAARVQPEELEFGAERFHSSEAQGTGQGIRHGVIEGGQIHAGALTQPQLKKTASDMRFMGTSFQKVSFTADDAYDTTAQKAREGAAWAKETAGTIGRGTVEGVRRVGQGAGQALGQIGHAAGEAIKNPWVDLALAALAGRAALGMGGRALRGAGRLVRGARVAEQAPGLLSRLSGGAKKMLRI